MTGTIRKRGATWSYQFSVGPRTGPDRRQITKGGFRTKKLAQDALTAAMHERRSGRGVDPSKITVEQFLLDEWLPVAVLKLKPSTAAGYRHVVDTRIVPALGSRRLQTVTTGDVARFYGDLRSAGLSETTIRQTHAILRRAMNVATQRRLREHSPMEGMDSDTIPKAAKPEMVTWAADQLRSFLDTTRTHWLGSLFAAAALTGLRRGELLGLQWVDVDIDASRLSVRHSRVAVRDTDALEGERRVVMVDGEPKSKRARVVDLGPATVALLRRHRAAQLEQRMAWGPAWIDSGLVFTREDGEPLMGYTVQRSFEYAIRKAGAPRIRFHDLRHTHATLALAAGVPAKVVQERLGHHSAAFTLDVYGHVMPGMQADAAARVDAVIFGRG